MAGRPPAHKFHELALGERVEVKGKQRKFVYQYVYQFNRSPVRKADGKRLHHSKESDRQYVVRVK